MKAADIRLIRLGQGRTLAEQAHLARVDASTISRMERGEQMPRPKALVRIAQVYCVEPAQLAAAVFANNAILAIPQTDSPATTGEPDLNRVQPGESTGVEQ